MSVELRCASAHGRSMSAGVRKDAQSLLALSGLETCELSLMLVGDRAIRTLNRNFRSHDAATDVLSFPQLDGPRIHENERGGGLTRRGPARSLRKAAGRRGDGAADHDSPPLTLGDIVISVDTARRQANELGVSLRARIRTLIIHGLLHLLGYDHERSAAEARRQFTQERRLAARFDAAAHTTRTQRTR